jgi:hypothetical protein
MGGLDDSLEMSRALEEQNARRKTSVEGKTFHIEEATFRRTGLAGFCLAFRRGRENFKPNRWYPSTWVIRVGLARRVRVDRGRAAPSAKGALGISNRTDPDNVGERRTTTKAPPALILRAVANSNRSLPFSSRLLTNTGIERGNRTHLRRSFSGWRRFKDSPRGPELLPLPRHLMGQITGIRAADLPRLTRITRSSGE